MYDALLEEFEDEVIRTPDDEESLRSLPLEEVDDTDDEDLIEPAPEVEADIQELKKAAAHLLPSGNLMIEDITPVIGAHIGPGAYGFAVISAKS